MVDQKESDLEVEEAEPKDWEPGILDFSELGRLMIWAN